MNIIWIKEYLNRRRVQKRLVARQNLAALLSTYNEDDLYEIGLRQYMTNLVESIDKTEWEKRRL